MAKHTQFDLRNPSTLPADAPTDDPLLDADEIGKRGLNSKRNAVNIDGYDSDSSNEGFDGRLAAKKRRKTDAEKGGSKDEEEADMFADLEESGNVGAGGVTGGDGDIDEEEGNDREGERGGVKGKKKAVKFMDEGETVQGENLGSKSGGHVSADFSVTDKGGEAKNGISASSAPSTKHEKKARASNFTNESSASSESEADDETRADMADEVDHELGAGSKKQHAPKLDAFNMRAEQEEGRFDSAGNYVRKAADPDAVHDQWLEGVSKKDMKRAKEAMEQREAESKKRQVEEDRVLTSDLLGQLIERLEVGETLLEALGRLGKGKKKKGWVKKRNAMEVDAAADPDEIKEIRRREAVEAITEAADMLLSRGQEDVYDTERELLMRQYQRETGEAWVEQPKAEVGDGGGNVGSGVDRGGGKWQYRWIDGRDSGKAHGDYDSALMKAWVEANYFVDGVEFHQVGTEEWSESVQFV